MEIKNNSVRIMWCPKDLAFKCEKGVAYNGVYQE